MEKKIFSVSELAGLLEVSERTVRSLLKGGEMPYYKDKGRITFNIEAVFEYFRKIESAAEAEAAFNYCVMRDKMRREFPRTIRTIQDIEAVRSTVRIIKGYNLVKRDNQALGFVYYVRYRHEGKTLPSKWCTHTNNIVEARKFALANREKLVKEYLDKKSGRGFELLERFYEKESPYFASDKMRSGNLSKGIMRSYENVIKKKLLPYLKKKKALSLDKITSDVIEGFQEDLLGSGINPQTVNSKMKAVRRVFKYLARKRIIKDNPCQGVKNIHLKKSDVKARGCFELDALRGVFNKEWSNEESRLLNMIICTTGMRNSEISRIKMSDIIDMDGARFLEIKSSKTESGLRLVPLAEKVYESLKIFACNKDKNEVVFKAAGKNFWRDALLELGGFAGMSEEELKKENITFYSGRHFWKTLMNAEGLGDDVEEVFMGHRVSRSVAKVYNHKDKRGKRELVKKAKSVYKILDKRLFSGKTT